ncbi:MAG: HTH domain-containing protein [Cyanobacteria bacterium REEB65]|nr:HTH domain-containing protein [Cyanobacteria bacterium REEB65]
MARPLFELGDEAEALWEEACARWQREETTADELADMLGLSRATVYRRLQAAQQRLEQRVLDANQAAYDAHRAAAPADPVPAPDPDPGRSQTSLDDGVYLTLTDDPRDEIRAYRDYSEDRVQGEIRYRQRPFYAIATLPAHETDPARAGDPTSHDGIGGTIVVGSGAIRYGSPGGRNRMPDPPMAGQRLRRNTLGTGSIAVVGRTKHTPDPQGLEGGTGTPTVGKSLTWALIGRDGTTIRVQAKREREAKRALKRLLQIAPGEPLPEGTRLVREG